MTGCFRSFIMSNADLFVTGSIHQGHELFSDISRGRQCSFMSFSALLCAQSLPIEHWIAATVDQILVEGDAMYLDALERQTIPDTETLSLTFLPDIARWSSPIEAKQSNQSPTEANKTNRKPNLAKGLQFSSGRCSLRLTKCKIRRYISKILPIPIWILICKQ